MNQNMAWNLTSGLSFVACLGAIAYHLYDPAKMGSQGVKPVLARSKTVTMSPDTSLEVVRSQISAREWTQDSKSLGGVILAELSASAEKNKIQFTDLRFDKSLVVADLQEAPFTVVVDGPFDRVIDFMRELESSDSKLGVSMLQVAASDHGPGSVKATVRLTAFVGNVGTAP